MSPKVLFTVFVAITLAATIESLPAGIAGKEVEGVERFKRQPPWSPFDQFDEFGREWPNCLRRAGELCQSWRGDMPCCRGLTCTPIRHQYNTAQCVPNEPPRG